MPAWSPLSWFRLRSEFGNLTLFPRRDLRPESALRIDAAIRPAQPGESSARAELHQACSDHQPALSVVAGSACVELRAHRDLVQSSPTSAAAEHMQPSLDITLWYTKSALPASDSFHDDKR